MSVENNRWTDEFYQLGAFLYNEPNHIYRQKMRPGSMVQFYRAMANLQRIESPLNHLFNVMLHLLPQRLKRELLSCFLESSEAAFETPLAFFNDVHRELDINPDNPFIHPDTVLRSAEAHICLESKVLPSTMLKLSQLYKYLRFLGHWRAKANARARPYLLFLTKKPLAAQWVAQERTEIFLGNDPIADLTAYLRRHDLPPEGRPQIELVLPELKLGAATWSEIGQFLAQELERLRNGAPSDLQEILETLLGDFLAELAQRQLWQPA